MDLFVNAKSVRIRSYNDKYLIADEDRLTTSLDRDRALKNAIWTVELVQEKDYIRLRSCYSTYLTASTVPFVPGFPPKKVIQTIPSKCDPATQWEPLRDGMQVRLRSLWGNFLRPNRGIPPWRNILTHDMPHRTKTKEKILWDVEVVEAMHPNTDKSDDPKFLRTRSVSL